MKLTGLDTKPTPPYEGGLFVQTLTGVIWGGPIHDVSHALDKLPAATVSNASDKKGRWFPQYCQGGRQIRDVTQRIRLIIPPPPKGLSLTTAQNKEVELKQIGQAMISLFYQYASDPSDILELKDAEKYQSIKSYALQSGKTLDIEKEFQISTDAIGGISYINRFVFLKPNDSDLVYLVPNRFFELNWVTKYYKAGVYLDRPIQGRSGFFGMSPERPIRVNNLATQPLSGVSVLTPARSKALYDFRRNFTILMPDAKMQEQLPELRRAFLNPDGSISTENSLRAKEQFWKLYIQKFTSVKEAQNEDPSFKDYEVSLDLNLFCLYGRQIGDLMSK